MRLTVDASVVTKWFVPEPLFEEARLVLVHHVDLHAPDMLLAEFANTIWKKRRRGEILDERPYMAELVGLGEIVELRPVHELIARAGQFATELDHPVYYCLYLACAEATDSILVTADRRFADKLGESYPGAKILDLGAESFADDLEAIGDAE